MTPEELQTLYQKAVELQSIGDHRSSISLLQKITKKIPHHFAAWHTLGDLYIQRNLLSEGIQCFKQSIKHCPEFYPASLSLAMLLYKQQNNIPEAKRILIDVSKKNPHAAEPLFLLSDLHLSQGDYDTSHAYLKKFVTHHLTQNISPSVNITEYFLQTQLDLSPYIPSITEEQKRLTTLCQNLDSLLEELTPQPTSVLPSTLTHGLFHLAYYDVNPRPLLEKIAAVYKKAYPGLSWVNPSLSTLSQTGRIKIGIVSAYLDKMHAVSYCFSPLIHSLSRDLYDIHYFRLASDHQNLAPLSIHKTLGPVTCVDLPFDNLEKARTLMADEKIDILWYTDIGMVPQSYFLAHARIAPIQCVSAGHPITSGLKTIDYFISSSLLEEPHAQENYTEKLALLPTLPIVYEDFSSKTPKLDRSSFKIPESKNIYLCAQTPLKIHPKMDPLFQQILEQDPNGLLVFCYKGTPLVSRLEERLQKALGPLFERCLFLPQLPQKSFYSFLNCVDVILDTFPFSGGNTALQAIAMGVPCVSLYQPHLRGSTTHALYTIMEMTDGLVHSPDEYVRACVRLGTSPSERTSLSEKILAKKHLIFAQDSIVQAYQSLFSSMRESHHA